MKNNPRLLLAKLRHANYAHAGEEEAIDIFWAHLRQHQDKAILSTLDMGCWRGGTAKYIQEKYNQTSIMGIDIDENAIRDAQAASPGIEFLVHNICNLPELAKKFDLFYLFNVYYSLSIPQQKQMLHDVTAIANDDAFLVIFDYFSVKPDPELLNDLAGQPMLPPSVDDLKLWLTNSGWEIVEVVDLQDKYRRWYSGFLAKLKNQRSELQQEFTDEAINQVETTFGSILKKIDSQVWSGNIVYAKKVKAF